MNVFKHKDLLQTNRYEDYIRCQISVMEKTRLYRGCYCPWKKHANSGSRSLQQTPVSMTGL